MLFNVWDNIVLGNAFLAMERSELNRRWTDHTLPIRNARPSSCSLRFL